MAGAVFHPLVVAEVRPETAEAVTIRFTVPDGLKPAFRFEPGQYLTLRRLIDGAECRRSYSICSAPADGELRVGIKRVEGGAFSCFANDDLAAGDTIEVMPPDGRFVSRVNGDAPRSYLFVAAGSGITPILSLIRHKLATEPESRMLLVYGNRASPTVMFAEELEALKNRHLGRLSLIHVLSRERQDVDLFDGRIDAAKIDRLCGRLIDAPALDEAFLCGPLGMVEEVRDAIVAAGAHADRIRVELFTTGTPPPVARRIDAVGEGTPIELVIDGRRTPIMLPAGEIGVVDAAARAGVSVPYSCKGGMCCTCRARLVEGEAAMAQNFALEPWEIKAGFILTCQCIPKSARLVLDYDQM